MVTVNSGYGTFESKYDQSLAVLDTQSGALADFPDDRTVARSSKQTLYSGLAFSRDGKHIYASMASLTDPTGDGKNDDRQRSCCLQIQRRQDFARTYDSICRCSNLLRAERRS